jgi:hypothetical protein
MGRWRKNGLLSAVTAKLKKHVVRYWVLELNRRRRSSNAIEPVRMLLAATTEDRICFRQQPWRKLQRFRAVKINIDKPSACGAENRSNVSGALKIPGNIDFIFKPKILPSVEARPFLPYRHWHNTPAARAIELCAEVGDGMKG